MSLRQSSPLRRTQFPGRAVHPDGENGARIGVPAEVRRELDLETGAEGDLVDIVYDRDEPKLEVYFDRDSVEHPRERVRSELENLDLDEGQIEAIIDRLV